MNDQPFKKPKRGDLIPLEIDKLTFGGKGLGRYEGQYVVFTPYTAPGDKLEVEVVNRKSSFAEGKITKLISPAENRIDPNCNIFGRCGGCSWQHLPISDQLHWKQKIVEESLYTISKKQSEPFEIETIAETPQSYFYRNKMEFTFGQEGPDEPLKLGFHMPGNWKHILDVEKCWLMPDALNPLLEILRSEGERQNLKAWNPVKHRGMLRQLIIRWSEHEQKALVALLTGEEKGLDFQALTKRIEAECPAIKGVLWGVNSQRSDVARAERIIDTWGDDTLVEKLENKTFRVSLASFFQTNTLGAEVLYSTTREYLDLTGEEVLFDAYCGTGSIGIFCSDHAKEIYGIELIKDAIWDARSNAELNGLTNCTFLAGDMARTLPLLKETIGKRIDRMVVDPPRSGMEKRALKQLLDLDVPQFVYVSCNPTTMARDLEVIIQSGYRLKKVKPVDMFPQTYHIECVALCVRAD